LRTQRLTEYEYEEADAASIPTENDYVRDGPSLNRTFTVGRKAAKRTIPWDQAPGGELLRAAYIPAAATKRPQLEEPFSASPEEDRSVYFLLKI
jgi:hypothetical protein